MFTCSSSFTSHLSRMHKNASVRSIYIYKNYIHVPESDPVSSHANSHISNTNNSFQTAPVQGEDHQEATGSHEINELESFELDNDNMNEDEDYIDYLILKDLSLFYLKLEVKHLIPTSTVHTKYSPGNSGNTCNWAKKHDACAQAKFEEISPLRIQMTVYLTL